MIKAYVDGTFYQGKWGGGYVIFDEDKILFQDCGIGIDHPDLNAMRNISGEMSAAMHATKWIKENVGSGIIVHDYTGLSKWVIGEWDTNREFTKIYKEFMQPYYQNGIIQFEWVKGHTRVLGNEIADKLAKESVIHEKHWKFS